MVIQLNVYSPCTLTSHVVCILPSETACRSKGSIIIYEMGGPYLPQILISLANDLIQANDLIPCPFIFPKDSKKIKVQNFSPPLNDASKIVRPPSRRVENFSPPL